jgi:hypothetical protein
MGSRSACAIITVSVFCLVLGLDRTRAQTAGDSCTMMADGACACTASGCFVCRSGLWAAQDGNQICAAGPRAPQSSYYVVPQPYFMTAPTASSLPNVNSLECSSASAGTVRYKDNKLEQCTGTDWTQLPTGSGASAGLCLPQFARLASYHTPNEVNLIRGQGSLLYALTNGGTILALSFSGSAFTLRGSRDITIGPAKGVYTTAAHVLVTYADRLQALRFDETSNEFLVVASIDVARIPADSPLPASLTEVTSDGRYFYVLYPPRHVLAFAFNGLAFTFLRAYTNPPFSLTTIVPGIPSPVPGGGDVLTITASGPNTGYGPGRIVMLGTQTGMKALSFDGTNFTEKYSQYARPPVGRLTSDGTYIHTFSSEGGILSAWTFDGDRIVPRKEAGPSVRSLLWGDRNGLFATLDSNVVQSLTFDGEKYVHGPKFLERLGENVAVDLLWSDGRHAFYIDRDYGLGAMRRGCVRFF